MKLIHTSDWHLGQNFMFRDRKEEHEQFLDWLLELMYAQAIDLVIVSGDIFDSATPPNYALKLYYSFLSRAASAGCRDIVIVGGNHDSISCLDAPKTILKTMGVHVVGGVTGSVDDEIIVTRDGSGNATAVVCAVPFLRDRDLRKSLPGESYEEKNRALAQGIKEHYITVATAGMATGKAQGSPKLPLIATGHLFAAGGRVREGEYLRDIHVGSLEKFSVSGLPKTFDYVALGHLHRPQKAGELNHIRYSGSPIPLSFSEAGTPKEVIQVSFKPGSQQPDIHSIPIPEFQQLRVIKGDIDTILDNLKKLKNQTDGREKTADVLPETLPPQRSVWIETHVTDETWTPDTEERIFQEVSETNLEIFAIKKTAPLSGYRSTETMVPENLDQLTPETVFLKRLDMEAAVSTQLKDEMILAFREITASIDEPQGSAQ